MFICKCLLHSFFLPLCFFAAQVGSRDIWAISGPQIPAFMVESQSLQAGLWVPEVSVPAHAEPAAGRPPRCPSGLAASGLTSERSLT